MDGCSWVLALGRKPKEEAMKAEEGAIIGYVLIDPETKKQVTAAKGACRIYKRKADARAQVRSYTPYRGPPPRIHVVFLGPEEA